MKLTQLLCALITTSLISCASAPDTIKAEVPRASAPTASANPFLPPTFIQKLGVPAQGPFAASPLQCRTVAAKPSDHHSYIFCTGTLSGYEVTYSAREWSFEGHSYIDKLLEVRLATDQWIWLEHRYEKDDPRPSAQLAEVLGRQKGDEYESSYAMGEDVTRDFKTIVESILAHSTTTAVQSDKKAEDAFFAGYWAVNSRAYGLAALPNLRTVNCDDYYFEIGHTRYYFAPPHDYTRQDADKLVARANSVKLCGLDGWTLLEAGERDLKAVKRICTGTENFQASGCYCAWTSGEATSETMGQGYQVIMQLPGENQAAPHTWELRPWYHPEAICALVLKGPAPPPQAK